jgi:hypothetical protein
VEAVAVTGLSFDGRTTVSMPRGLMTLRLIGLLTSPALFCGGWIGAKLRLILPP